MLINADAKALELFSIAYLSQDGTMMEELRNPSIDLHSNNQKDLVLPSRLIAKVFVFRVIYNIRKGGGFSFVKDPDFFSVGKSEKQWQVVIDRFFDKYHGIDKWRNKNIAEVISSGQLTLPTGRVYTFSRDWNRWGKLEDERKIYNYPVQGLGAEIMVLARIALFRRIRSRASLNAVKFICTVHDSIVLDVPDELVNEVVEMIFQVWDDLPGLFERAYKVPFNLPLRVETKVGMDWLNMKEVKRAN